MISDGDEYRFETTGYPRLFFKIIASGNVIPHKLHDKTLSTGPARVNSGYVNLIVASYQRDNASIHCGCRQLCGVRCSGTFALP
jgi:hypothetical protein